MHVQPENSTMKKILIVPAVVTLLSVLNVYTALTEETKLLPAPDVIPPATEEMQHPGFWIDRIPDPDRVIMTPDEIRRFNEKNLNRPLEFRDINRETISWQRLDERYYQGLQFRRSDPLSVASVNGDSLKKGIQSGADYLGRSTLYDRRWIPYPGRVKNDIIESMDVDSVPATVVPRYGIICRHTLNRRVPTENTAYSSQFNWLDVFQTGSYETGRPVAILHKSKNGDWFYVRSEFSYRWIPADNVAVGSPGEIRYLSEPDNFIVALAHKIPVYGDPRFEYWMTDIYQGARLRLINKTEDGYQVLVPRRKSDGSLEVAAGWVKPDADVNVGYQSFTQRNIIDTIFKILYHPYGWGDSCHERDCCGIIRTVFDTFGIFTPRAPTHQFYYTDHAVTFPKELPLSEKYSLFDSVEPGITICGFGGHIMMYLGKVGDNYFVIHSNGYSYHDADGNEMRVARTSVTDLELEGGSDAAQFTNISVFKP